MPSRLWILILIILHDVTALWYSRPMFDSCASWNPNGVPFANKNTLGECAHGLFIDKNNTIYAGSWGGSVINI
ncbi:hypothetical protein I4U23_027362 [Adineta vaga]|nr:hypothetical protein I4U23_027362 [Adineta vaga]